MAYISIRPMLVHRPWLMVSKMVAVLRAGPALIGCSRTDLSLHPIRAQVNKRVKDSRLGLYAITIRSYVVISLDLNIRLTNIQLRLCLAL